MKKGQVLIVTLLVLSVLVTIALSIASRSVTEVQVSSTQDESTRALEAAEVGLERYIGTNVAETGQTVEGLNGATFNVPNPADLGNKKFFAIPYLLDEGDVATVDLPSGNIPWITVCWGNGALINPKIEVEIYYEDSAHNVYVKRNGYDPVTPPISGFYYQHTMTGSSNCGTSNNYNYSYKIFLNGSHAGGGMGLDLTTNNAIFMRVRMLDNGSSEQMVAIQSPQDLPKQGGIVESIGVAGNTSQKVRASISYWDLPAMFDSAIFSGTSLTK